MNILNSRNSAITAVWLDKTPLPIAETMDDDDEDDNNSVHIKKLCILLNYILAIRKKISPKFTISGLAVYATVDIRRGSLFVTGKYFKETTEITKL